MTSPPEPDLTPQGMIDRAVALRPQLVEQQAETEERTYYSQEMHEEFLRAGFYRIYVPRRYGGYEFDMRTYMCVMFELLRGCPSTG
jgi:3-hydroxy-9,10-secoandrosta-1,3,5(10)-triene-9,17-dione monooxygenase